MVLGDSLNELQDWCKDSKLNHDADGSSPPPQTAQGSPARPSPGPRTTRERPSGIRGEHLRGGYPSSPATRSAGRAVALHPAAVPGARDGQELDLPALAQRGDPKREAGAHHQGKAGRAGRVPPEP